MLGTYVLSDKLFLFCLSDHNIWHRLLYFLVIVLVASLFVCIVIKLGQSIADRNSAVSKWHKIIFSDNATMLLSSLPHFDFDSVLSLYLTS